MSAERDAKPGPAAIAAATFADVRGDGRVARDAGATPARPDSGPDARAVLGPEDAGRLVEFARACRAATRAVGLYPPAHPAVAAALGALADVCARPGNRDSWPIGILPTGMLLDGRPLPRPDIGASEMAALLHTHHIGQMTVQPTVEPATWSRFLGLLAQAPEELQRQGGIARVWATTGGRLIEIREIDYGSIVRERAAGEQVSWELVLRHCLQGESVDLDERALQLLAEIAADPARLADLARRLSENGGQDGAVRSPAAALLAMLRTLVTMLARTQPERLEPVLDSIATAACTFSPDLVVDLLASRAYGTDEHGSVDVAGDILARMTDQRLAGFVAKSVIVSQGATARLAAAFFALVPDPERRGPLLALARAEVARSPLGRDPKFERVWRNVETLLGSYNDQAFVSGDYAKDLATARVKAADTAAIVDDPPDRVAAWLATVADQAVRSLDLALLLDLLALEEDAMRWRDIADVVVAHIEDVLLVGDFEAGSQLVHALAAAAASGTADEAAPVPAGTLGLSRQSAAAAAIDRLTYGPALGHAVDRLQAIDDEDFEHVKRITQSLGAGVIRPLAEMLAVQERARTRQRLTDLLIAFGALGRQSAEQLKQSANPSVRRVAVYLLREFGGSEALPDLELLLDDAEPHVQREAVRAILQIGTDEAYSVLDRALRSGHARSRDAILRLLDLAGDERAAPLFAYIVRRGDYRKGLRAVYLKAVAALGRLGGQDGVAALKEGLYRGEWWAPVRTRSLRAAAARSLRQIGTPDAIEVLRVAAERGPRGVRAAARPYTTGLR